MENCRPRPTMYTSMGCRVAASTCLHIIIIPLPRNAYCVSGLPDRSLGLRPDSRQITAKFGFSRPNFLNGFLTSLDLDLDPIAPKFELDLRITIMYHPTKFHQVWSNSFCVILYTDRQTDRHTEVITISRFSRDNNVHTQAHS